MSDVEIQKGASGSAHTAQLGMQKANCTAAQTPVLADPLAFVIQECTFILSAMRKATRSSTSPFAAILLNQFLNDNASSSAYPEDSSLSLSALANAKSNTYYNSKNESDSSNGRAGKQAHAKFKEDDHFISGFVELRSILSDSADLSLVDIITLLQPFLVVIKSPSTTCHITNLAISSLAKFFQYGIINSEQSNIVQALAQIVSTLAHCRFEGADQTQDDLLLVKIIQLLEFIVVSDLGDFLTDDSMYEIISTCFSLAINTRRRDMLRSIAETSVLSITQVVFSKLKDLELEPEVDHNTKSAQVEFVNDSLPVDTIGRSTPTPTPELITDTLTENSETDPQAEETTTVETTNEPQTETELETALSDEGPESPGTFELTNSDADLSPYGIACMREFLNHTVDILSPDNRFRFTESTRALALEILIRIIEVSGTHITRHNQLFSLIADNCCHHIVQIIQNNESGTLVALSMKLFLHCAISYPNMLKIQLELILTTIFQSIVADEKMLNDDLTRFNETVFEISKKGKFETSSLTEAELTELKKEFDSGKPSQVKEFLIEALSVLWCRSPYLFINIFKSYDCDFDRPDLSNLFIKLLCRLSYSDVSVLTTAHVPPICLDGLLAFVNGIYERVNKGIAENINVSEYSTKNPLVQQYNKKFDFISCVQIWNEKPEKGLEALHQKGFIKDPKDDREVATFLFVNSGRIDKKKLGELLAKPTKINLLKEFVGLLDFKNLRPDESLRMLLNYFRLPGEAQQIDRIVTTFNDRYIECQDADAADGDEDEEEKVLPDGDAMFVLSFSIIMLNTDLHNPNIKKPMTLEDYQRNLRGCHKGKNFPTWYTEKMYNSIKEKEIIMPEEHKGTAKWFETVWHSLVAEQDSKRITDSHTMHELWTTSNDDSIGDLLSFDKILFEKHYRDLIGTFVIMFDDATHDSVITRMMSTVEKCAAIAIYFGMDDVVDSIIEITAHCSTLTGVKKSEFSLVARDILPVVEIDNRMEPTKTLFVSDLSVLFGRDYRAQLSMIVLFRVIKRSGYKVSKGWFYAVKAMMKLFEVGLIDPNMFTKFQEHFKLDTLDKVQPEFKLNKDDSSKDNGLFSTFSSYLKVLSAETMEPSQEEVESTLYALDFIKTIGVANLFSHVADNMNDTDSMNKLVQVLVALLPSRNDSTKRYFMEQTLLLLESVVNLLVISKSSKLIHQILSKCDAILSDDKEMKMSTVCRILSYKLILLNKGLSKSDNNEKLFTSTMEKIHSLATNSRESFVKHGTNILIPLEELLTGEGWCVAEVKLNSKYWAILRIIASSPKNTEDVFKFFLHIEKERSELLTYDNYMDILGLLDEISAVGAYGAQWEHEYDKLMDSGLKVEDKKSPFQELVNTSRNSITATSELSIVIESESFQKTVQAAEVKGEIISPWYPLIEAISHQCYNPCRQVTDHALTTLTSMLITDRIPVHSLSLDKVIDAACLRLLIELMKPEVNSTDVKGMIKTQRDVIALTCKVMLTHDEFNDSGRVVEKLFAIASQLLQQNRNIYPKAGHGPEDEIIEFLRNLLMIRKDKVDLVALKGYRMDGVLKKLVEEVIKESEKSEKSEKEANSGV